jgi:ribosomal protein S27AE
MSRSELTPAEWQARSEQLALAHQAALDRQPKLCPHCADDSSLAPMFVGDTWECGACSLVFTWPQPAREKTTGSSPQ